MTVAFPIGLIDEWENYLWYATGPNPSRLPLFKRSYNYGDNIKKGDSLCHIPDQGVHIRSPVTGKLVGSEQFEVSVGGLVSRMDPTTRAVLETTRKKHVNHLLFECSRYDSPGRLCGDAFFQLVDFIHFIEFRVRQWQAENEKRWLERTFGPKSKERKEVFEGHIDPEYAASRRKDPEKMLEGAKTLDDAVLLQV